MKFDKQLIVMVGNIGSGKTTVCKKLKDKGYVIISRDALRYMVGAGTYVYDEKLEMAIFESEDSIIRSFMRLGVNIIVDETGICKKYRESYLKLAKTYGYYSSAYVMPKLSMKESVDRRMNNPHDQADRKIWEGVWKKFDNLYEEPTREEGFIVIKHKDLNE